MFSQNYIILDLCGSKKKGHSIDEDGCTPRFLTSVTKKCDNELFVNNSIQVFSVLKVFERDRPDMIY